MGIANCLLSLPSFLLNPSLLAVEGIVTVIVNDRTTKQGEYRKYCCNNDVVSRTSVVLLTVFLFTQEERKVNPKIQKKRSPDCRFAHILKYVLFKRVFGCHLPTTAFCLLPKKLVHTSFFQTFLPIPRL